MTDQEKDPKIIVDDDWKSQVQQEKEQLQEQAEHPAPESGEPELPPPSLSMLVHTLATQAMASLGFLPDPVSGQPNKNLPLAKHFIDTIGVLDEKTQGNLTDDEAELIRESLHQLRMAFVAIGNEEAQTPPAAEPTSTIELP